MNLITNLNNHKLERSSVTIGNFDGVHKGHIALFEEAKKNAEKIKGNSVVITFNPHPLKIIKSSKHSFSLITLYEQKIELIKNAGIDTLISIPFTKEFANVTAEKFIKEILIDRVKTKFLVVGKDYSFGKDRAGNIELLEKYSKEYDFKLFVPNWIKTNGKEKISSTRIRELIADGDMKKVLSFLGRPYQIIGEVEEGAKIGTKIGFPTANIKVFNELTPKRGVYAAKVYHKNRSYKGALNIGIAPTLKTKHSVEVHILDFNEKDIYGEQIKIDFIERLRDETKFVSKDELIKQIKLDIKKVREVVL